MRAADAIPEAMLTAGDAAASSAPPGAQALQRARSAQVEETEEETRRRVKWIKYYVAKGQPERAFELGWDGQPFQLDPQSRWRCSRRCVLRPLCVLAGAAELTATALFAWYAFGLGSIGGAFSGTLALGILALRTILALALGLYAWRCLCREWRNGPPLLTTPGPPLPALALLILLPADLELLQLVPWRRRQLDGLPTAALLGLTATLSLSHNLATLLLLAYTAAAVAPPPLRPLPVVCGVLALACAAFLGIRRAAMLLGCCGADAAAEPKYDACTASTEAALPASVAAVDLEMAERGAAGGAAAVAWCVPAPTARQGTSSPAARRAVTRQRTRRARGRARSGSPASDAARASAAHVPHQSDTADAACAAARAPAAAPPVRACSRSSSPAATAPPPPPPPPRRARAAPRRLGRSRRRRSRLPPPPSPLPPRPPHSRKKPPPRSLPPRPPLTRPPLTTAAVISSSPPRWCRRRRPASTARPRAAPIRRATRSGSTERARRASRRTRSPSSARTWAGCGARASRTTPKIQTRRRRDESSRRRRWRKPGRPPPSQVPPFRVLLRRAPPRRAPPSTARDAPRLTRKRSSLPTIRDFGETLEVPCSVIAT